MNLFVKPLKYQFLSLFFGLCYCLFFILNFPLLCHLIYFYCFLLFFFFSFFFPFAFAIPVSLVSVSTTSHISSNILLSLLIVATNTSNSKDVQTYIKPVYLYYSHIRVYKRNLIKNLLLQYILYILVHALQYITYYKVYVLSMSLSCLNYKVDIL